jgi:hypothetical protein
MTTEKLREAEGKIEKQEPPCQSVGTPCPDCNCKRDPYVPRKDQGERTTTPLKSIRARCLDCRGHEVKAVRECDIDDCHLYRLRMGKGSRSTLKIIRAYCIDCCAGQRAEVKQCTTKKCSLWPYRSGRRPQTGQVMPEIASRGGVWQGKREHATICPFQEEVR